MTQKQKDLLLKDLCARLPYGVKCLVNYTICNETTDYNDVKSSVVDTITEIDPQTERYFFRWPCEWFESNEFKPYLFPLSSMTEEQRKEWLSLMIKDSYGILCPTIESFDYLYKNHIDVRGFISLGLAIDATGLNIY